jgi:hypothetical protein
MRSSQKGSGRSRSRLPRGAITKKVKRFKVKSQEVQVRGPVVRVGCFPKEENKSPREKRMEQIRKCPLPLMRKRLFDSLEL